MCEYEGHANRPVLNNDFLMSLFFSLNNIYVVMDLIWLQAPNNLQLVGGLVV